MPPIIAVLLGLTILPHPSYADSNGIQQSPLLMRRAGPSCQPGDLGAQPGAGYLYRLGPCAGAAAPAAQGGEAARSAAGWRRRF